MRGLEFRPIDYKNDPLALQAAGMVLSSFDNELLLPDPAATYDAQMEGFANFCVVGAGRLLAAGSVSVEQMDRGSARIKNIAVAWDYRRRGVGRFLMNSLEETAAEAGAETTWVEALVEAIPFYEKLGYRGVNPTLPGLLKKQLSTSGESSSILGS